MNKQNKDWQPLGLESWSANNFGSSNKKITHQLELVFPEGGYRRDAAETATRASLAQQAARNHLVGPLESIDEDLYWRAQNGLLLPHEAVGLLDSQSSMKSIELARLTHLGDWDTNDKIDTPVRHDLEQGDIDTVALHYDSYFKLVGIDKTQAPSTIEVKRKREVYSHLGGGVLSVVVNHILVDLTDKSPETRDLRKSVHDSLASFRGGDIYTDKRRHYLRETLESFMRTKDSGQIPGSIMPLSTIYYATRASERAA